MSIRIDGLLKLFAPATLTLTLILALTLMRLNGLCGQYQRLIEIYKLKIRNTTKYNNLN